MIWDCVFVDENPLLQAGFLHLPTAWLFGSAGDFNQVITELGFDRAMNLAEFTTENDLVELSDHLAR